MLFGSLETFAIEAVTEPEIQPPSAGWGRMRVWCQGFSIGDIEEKYCALYTAYSGFKRLSHSLPKLWLPEFQDFTDIDLCHHLDAILYGYRNDLELEDLRTASQCRLDLKKYGQFDFLNNWGEQFDRSSKSFIICTPNGIVKIFNYAFPINICREIPISKVSLTITDFLAWFESEQIRLRGNPSA